MKRTIRLNESELKRMISESVGRVLGEGVIPEDAVLTALKDYISDGDLQTVIKVHPQLVDVIARWLSENGEREFIRYVLQNFLPHDAYLD